MPQGTRICKICGKEYPFCKTANPNNAFRYQDVACCPEHGAQYLEEVLRARGELTEKKGKKKAAPAPKEPVVEPELPEEEEDEEDDEEDEDEEDGE